MRANVVTVIMSYAQNEVNQEESEQSEVDGMKKGADFHTALTVFGKDGITRLPVASS